MASNRPQNINYGAKDGSVLDTPLKPIVISGHTGLVFTYAEKGPLDPTIVNGGHFTALYGSKTLNRKQPFFTPLARPAEVLSGAGNSFIAKRIIPEDNDKISNLTLYVDIIQDSVDVYKRNADGSIAYDSDGNPVVDVTVTGYRLKLISEYTDELVTTPIGTKTTVTGTMVKSDDDTILSSRIPIMEYRGAYQGSTYNNYAPMLYIPSKADADVNVGEANLSLPIVFSLFNRIDANSTGTPVYSTEGITKKQFTLKPDAVHGLSGAGVELDDIVATWSNMTESGNTVYPSLDTPYVYKDNLEKIVSDLHNAEKVYANASIELNDGSTGNTSDWFDFVDTANIDDQAWFNNPLNAKSTAGVPAMTYYIDETDVTLTDKQAEVHLGANPLYLNGGIDGTLTIENLNKGISAYMAKYGDANDPIQNVAMNIENVLYDAGAELDTKLSMVNFIKLRKDTCLILSTVVNGTVYADATEHKTVGSLLKTELMLAPESTFNNTGVARAMIVVGSGEDKTDPAVARYPLTMHIAKKAAYLMGGKTWNSNFMFDRGGKNIIKDFINVEPTVVADLVADDMWNLGMVWPTPYDTKVKHFLSMQNVYDVERSALGNLFMSMALTIDAKVADAVHRMYSGSTELKPAQFVLAVEADANRMLDVFDGIIEASAKVVITDVDAQNGFSWHLDTYLAGNISLNIQHHTATITLR